MSGSKPNSKQHYILWSGRMPGKWWLHTIQWIYLIILTSCDVLSYVVSGLIPLKIFGFFQSTKYFHFLCNNRWLQGYFKFVRKTHNIKLDLRAHPCCWSLNQFHDFVRPFFKTFGPSINQVIELHENYFSFGPKGSLNTACQTEHDKEIYPLELSLFTIEHIICMMAKFG